MVVNGLYLSKELPKTYSYFTKAQKNYRAHTIWLFIFEISLRDFHKAQKGNKHLQVDSSSKLAINKQA